jgi:L-lactate dehydrogenase complex protein LldF
MLLSLRATAEQQEPVPFDLRVGMRVFGAIATRPWLYRFFAGAARFVLRRLATDGWVKKAPGLAAGWTRVRDLRAPAVRTFQDRWRERPA